MAALDKNYWNARYRENSTGWDIGYASPPIKGIIDVIQDKASRILVPGAGNAYEAEYSYKAGFNKSFVLDISDMAIARFRERCPDFPADHCFNEDFFDHSGQYDVILEQTFFCALEPGLRPEYISKMASLLKPGGRLAGLLFDFPLTEQGPPFGGSLSEYQSLFSLEFEIEKMERCRNSIAPRLGSELIFSCKKRS